MTQRIKIGLDDLPIIFITKVNTVFLFIFSLFLASLILKLPIDADRFFQSIVVIVFLTQLALWGLVVVDRTVKNITQKKMSQDATSVPTISFLGFLSKVFLWIVVVLLALDNLGINISALVAGLGVGGVAIALASQQVLGDLFSSLSIVLDKPFVHGDFIIVGDLKGTVEHIGLKTTRLRSLSGEQLIFSNSDLLQSRIRNYKRMFERRVSFMLGVIYRTPHEKLLRIPQIVREVVEGIKKLRFEHCFFQEYGNFALNFNVVFWVKDADYSIYAELHQAVNLAIHQRFQAEGIAFAYSTPTAFGATPP